MKAWTVEKGRTSAGYKLWADLSPSEGVEAATHAYMTRVRVRVLKMWGDPHEKAGEVETSLDGGPWVSEGIYKLIYQTLGEGQEGATEDDPREGYDIDF